MKKLIEQADQLLAMLTVSGNSVMLLADARKVLGEIYRMAPEDRPERAGAEASGPCGDAGGRT